MLAQWKKQDILTDNQNNILDALIKLERLIFQLQKFF